MRGLVEPDCKLLRRIHGEVSSEAVKWKHFPTLHGTDLQEVLYHKSEGEGIAKVGPIWMKQEYYSGFLQGRLAVRSTACWRTESHMLHVIWWHLGQYKLFAGDH